MKRRKHWLYRHSLGLVAVALLLTWIAGYVLAGDQSRLGIFFGNAIADWSGSVVIIFGTKFLYEVGSAESRPVRRHESNRWLNSLRRHSLLIFLALTGIGWFTLYLHLNPTARWGQVVGNILSEWLQIAGLVFLTKELAESGSKESRR